MRTLVAILAMSPALLHAQAHSSAQPVSTPPLQASLSRPAVAPLSIQPAKEAASAPAVSVFTAPRLVQAAPFLASVSGSWPAIRTVVLDVEVDKTGTPVEVKVLNSNDPLSNLDAIDTVRRYHYEPATLDGKPVASRLKLTFNIENPQE